MSASEPPGNHEALDAQAEFRAFNAAFEVAAAAAGGVVTRTFLMAAKKVLVEFAGPALVPYLTPAISHLEAAFQGDPDLRIRAWDSKSTGVPLPQAAGSLEAHQERGMPGSWGRGAILSAYLRPDPGLSMFDVEARHGVYWLPALGQGGFEDRATPFRTLLSWGLSFFGVQFLHGACIGPAGAGAGVLVVGPGGSGKSSTALASVAAGMDYVSDDYCAVSLEQGVVAHSLYSSAKLTADNLGRFPWARPLLTNPDRVAFEKGVILLNDHLPGQIAARLDIRAVVAPTVRGTGPTTVSPITGSRALRAIAPSTLLQLSSTRSGSLAFLAEVARGLPAFEMRIGFDVEGIPEAINQVFALVSGVSG